MLVPVNSRLRWLICMILLRIDMVSVSQIIQIEKRRYQEKGIFNSCLALGLLVGIMWSSVQIGSWIWPGTVENEAKFILIGSFVLHKLFQLISFAIYLPGYLDIVPEYRKYRINTKTSKPWERINWPQVRKRAFIFVLTNQFIVYPLIMLVSAQTKLNVRFSGFPTFWELFSQVIFIYYLEDFLFYWGHRLFHQNKWLYSFHKVHHEYDNLYSLMTEFFHPIDFVLGSVLPSVISVLALGDQVHCFTLLFLVGWKVLTSTENHSGYDFPWSPMRVLPFVSGASYHDHHHSHNVGNYAGSCYIWDLLLGTNKEYMKEWLKKE